MLPDVIIPEVIRHHHLHGGNRLFRMLGKAYPYAYHTADPATREFLDHGRVVSSYDAIARRLDTAYRMFFDYH